MFLRLFKGFGGVWTDVVCHFKKSAEIWNIHQGFKEIWNIHQAFKEIIKLLTRFKEIWNIHQRFKEIIKLLRRFKEIWNNLQRLKTAVVLKIAHERHVQCRVPFQVF